MKEVRVCTWNISKGTKAITNGSWGNCTNLAIGQTVSEIFLTTFIIVCTNQGNKNKKSEHGKIFLFSGNFLKYQGGDNSTNCFSLVYQAY